MEPEGLSEEEMIDSLFYRCDLHDEGRVEISTVIQFLKNCLGNGNNEPDLVELAVILEEESNEGNIDFTAYRNGVKKWISEIRHRCENTSLMESEGLLLGSDNGELIPLTGPGEELSVCVETSGIGDGPFTNEQDIGDVLSQLEDLKFQNRKLTEENAKLHYQLESQEETASALASDIQNRRQEEEQLKKKVKSLQELVDIRQSVIEENEELKTKMVKLRERKKELENKVMALERDNMNLEKQTRSLENKWQRSQQELDVAHKELQELQNTCSEHKHLLLQTQELKTSKEILLTEKTTELSELKEKFQELVESNEKLEEERDHIQTVLSDTQAKLQRLESQFGHFESGENSFTNGNSFKKSKSKLSPPKHGYSTPISRNSICMELKDRLDESKHLPSPLCEKHEISKDISSFLRPVALPPYMSAWELDITNGSVPDYSLELLRSRRGRNSGVYEVDMEKKILGLKNMEKDALHKEIIKLYRLNVELAEKCHKAEVREEELQEMVTQANKKVELDKQNINQLEDSLQTSRLAREVDLKDLWRLVQVDVEKECLESQSDSSEFGSSDYLKHQISQEIETLKTRLQKKEAALGALNFTKGISQNSTKGISQNCMKGRVTFNGCQGAASGSPLVDALAIDFPAGKKKRQNRKPCREVTPCKDCHRTSKRYPVVGSKSVPLLRKNSRVHDIKQNINMSSSSSTSGIGDLEYSNSVFKGGNENIPRINFLGSDVESQTSQSFESNTTDDDDSVKDVKSSVKGAMDETKTDSVNLVGHVSTEGQVLRRPSYTTAISNETSSVEDVHIPRSRSYSFQTAIEQGQISPTGPPQMTSTSSVGDTTPENETTETSWSSVPSRPRFSSTPLPELRTPAKSVVFHPSTVKPYNSKNDKCNPRSNADKNNGVNKNYEGDVTENSETDSNIEVLREFQDKEPSKSISMSLKAELIKTGHISDNRSSCSSSHRELSILLEEDVRRISDSSLQSCPSPSLSGFQPTQHISSFLGSSGAPGSAEFWTLSRSSNTQQTDSGHSSSLTSSSSCQLEETNVSDGVKTEAQESDAEKRKHSSSLSQKISTVAVSSLSPKASTVAVSSLSPKTSTVAVSSLSPTTSTVATSSLSPKVSTVAVSSLTPKISTVAVLSLSPTTSTVVVSSLSPKTSTVVVSSLSPKPSTVVVSSLSPKTSTVAVSSVSPKTSTVAVSSSSPKTSTVAVISLSSKASALAVSSLSPKTSTVEVLSRIPLSSTATKLQSPSTPPKLSSVKVQKTVSKSQNLPVSPEISTTRLSMTGSHKLPNTSVSPIISYSEPSTPPRTVLSSSTKFTVSPSTKLNKPLSTNSTNLGSDSSQNIHNVSSSDAYRQVPLIPSPYSPREPVSSSSDFSMPVNKKVSSNPPIISSAKLFNISSKAQVFNSDSSKHGVSPVIETLAASKTTALSKSLYSQKSIITEPSPTRKAGDCELLLDLTNSLNCMTLDSPPKKNSDSLNNADKELLVQMEKEDAVMEIDEKDKSLQNGDKEKTVPRGSAQNENVPAPNSGRGSAKEITKLDVKTSCPGKGGDMTQLQGPLQNIQEMVKDSPPRGASMSAGSSSSSKVSSSVDSRLSSVTSTSSDATATQTKRTNNNYKTQRQPQMIIEDDEDGLMSRDDQKVLESSLSKLRETHLARRRDQQRTRMPQLSELKERDGAPLQNGEAEEEVEVIQPPQPNDDPVMPSIPDEFLSKLGLTQDGPSSDELSDQEIESKFTSLSLAFKTDSQTLEKRLEIQERSRDIAEQNVDKELQGLRSGLATLNQICTDPQVREVLTKIQNHIDVLEKSTARVSSRAEVLGAIQQEKRMSKAVDIMVHHVENLRRVHEREHAELEEAKKLLQDSRSLGPTTVDVTGNERMLSRRSASVCPNNILPGQTTVKALRSVVAVGTAEILPQSSRRRVSEIALPKVLGGTGAPNLHISASMDGPHSPDFKPQRSPSPLRLENSIDEDEASSTHTDLDTHINIKPEKSDAKSRFQAVVASTAVKSTVANTLRRASLERQNPVQQHSTTSSPEISRDNSQDKNLDAQDKEKQKNLEEEAFKKGYEQGMRASLGQDLSSLREQQNQINQSLGDIMDSIENHTEEPKSLKQILLERADSLIPKVKMSGWRIRMTFGCFFIVMAIISVIVSLFPVGSASLIGFRHYGRPPL